jgi:hypothetical protein
MGNVARSEDDDRCVHGFSRRRQLAGPGSIHTGGTTAVVPRAHSDASDTSVTTQCRARAVSVCRRSVRAWSTAGTARVGRRRKLAHGNIKMDLAHCFVFIAGEFHCFVWL